MTHALHRHMKSLVASAFALAMLAPVAAHAGTYVGLGIGTGAQADGGFSKYGSEGRHSGRLILGYRFGQVSVEGDISDYGLTSSLGTVDWNAMSVGVAGKLHLPITKMFEGYVRLGLQQTKVSTDASGSQTEPISGSGWMGGLGVEYRLNMLVSELSVWADYSRESTRFKAGNSQVDGTANMWMIGLSIGI